MTTRESATEPEDLTRLFVERANAGDAEGLAELYERDAVLAYPPGSRTVGREAIRAVCEQMLTHVSHFELEEALPTVCNGDSPLPRRGQPTTPEVGFRSSGGSRTGPGCV